MSIRADNYFREPTSSDLPEQPKCCSKGGLAQKAGELVKRQAKVIVGGVKTSDVITRLESVVYQVLRGKEEGV